MYIYIYIHVWVDFRMHTSRRRVRNHGLWQAVADFVASVFECFGKTSRYSSIGYGKSFGTNAGGGFGLTAGAGADLRKLIQHESKPGASVCIGFGISIGPGTGGARAGVGVGGSFCCGTSGCSIGISVGAVAQVSVDGSGPPCVFGKHMGPFACKRTEGVSLMLTCCSYNFMTGATTCR